MIRIAFKAATAFLIRLARVRQREIVLIKVKSRNEEGTLDFIGDDYQRVHRGVPFG